MKSDQKRRAIQIIGALQTRGATVSVDPVIELLQELIDAPEPEPVARVTGYYAGYLSIETVDGRVLSTGTALYAAPPRQSEHHLEMVRDAERYRWLLANYAFGDGFVAIDSALNDGEAAVQLSPAIDAAIAAEKGGA